MPRLYALLLLACALNVNAASKSWDDGGGDASWDTAANWDGDALPDFDDGDNQVDDVTFITILAGQATDLGGDKTVNSLSFTAGGDYRIDNHTLTVKSGAITRNSSAGQSIQTINSNVVLGANGVITVNGNHSINSRLHIEGSIGDGGNAYGLHVVGGRQLELNGPLTYTGTTTINGGTVTVRGASATPAWVINSGTTLLYGAASASTVLFNGGTLVVNDATNIAAAAFTFDGGRLQSQNFKTNVTFNNPITILSAMDLGGTDNITLTSNIALTGDRTISLYGISRSDIVQTLDGVISGPHQLLLIPNGRLLRLNGANTYTGGTDCRRGVLYIGNGSALGTGTLRLAANSDLRLLSSATGFANPVIAEGSFDLDSDVPLAGPLTLEADCEVVHLGVSGETLHFAGNISESGGSFSLGLSSYGDRVIRLDGDNSFSGGTIARLGGPPLRIGTDTALGTGLLSIELRVADTTELQAVTQAVQISNDMGVVTGHLVIGGSASMPLISTGDIAGDVTFLANAAIAGDAIVYGNLTMNSGAAIDPGNSVGTVTVNGDLAVNAGATFEVEVDGAAADKVIVNGTVTLAGNLAVSVINPPTLTSYVIIDNDDLDAVVGTFTGVPEGGLVSDGTLDYQVSYVGGDGNDVVLTPQFTCDCDAAITAVTNALCTALQNADPSDLATAWVTINSVVDAALLDNGCDLNDPCRADVLAAFNL